MKKIILFFCLLLFACSPSESDLRKKDGLYYMRNEDLTFSGSVDIDDKHKAQFVDGKLINMVLKEDFVDELNEKGGGFPDAEWLENRNRNIRNNRNSRNPFNNSPHDSSLVFIEGKYYLKNSYIPFQGTTAIYIVNNCESYGVHYPETIYTGTYEDGVLVKNHFTNFDDKGVGFGDIKFTIPSSPNNESKHMRKMSYYRCFQIDDGKDSDFAKSIQKKVKLTGTEIFSHKVDRSKQDKLGEFYIVDAFEDSKYINLIPKSPEKQTPPLQTFKIVFHGDYKDERILYHRKTGKKEVFNSALEMRKKYPGIQLYGTENNLLDTWGFEGQMYGYDNAGNPDTYTNSRGQLEVDYGNFGIQTYISKIGGKYDRKASRTVYKGSYIMKNNFPTENYITYDNNNGERYVKNYSGVIKEHFFRHGTWTKVVETYDQEFTNNNLEKNPRNSRYRMSNDIFETPVTSKIVEEWIYDRGKLISNRKL